MNLQERIGLISSELDSRFGARGEAKFFRAPGRVDLMGSHTDYNQGYILAATVDRDVVIGARERDDGVANFYSCNMEQEVRVNLDGLRYDPEHGWANYPKGMIKELVDVGVALGGIDLVVHGVVPVGGNLSSSAALEAATCEAVLGVARARVPIWERFTLAWRAENAFIGLPCGIMDQFTVFMAGASTAVLLDCRDLQYERVPFDSRRTSLAVIDSGRGRELVASKYAERVDECQAAVRVVAGARSGVSSLRDVALDDLEGLRGQLGDVLYRRARHVVSENERVLRAAGAMRSGDAAGLGRVMVEGYHSCRDDYENSTPELDTLHELVMAAPGVLGARICGAGWGGCLVALVESDQVGGVQAAVVDDYQAKTGLDARVWPVVPSDGAGPLEG